MQYAGAGAEGEHLQQLAAGWIDIGSHGNRTDWRDSSSGCRPRRSGSHEYTPKEKAASRRDAACKASMAG
ncbi:Uncharacterized protein ChrSV_3101 [Chromobacterium vaccinii]|nr:Uncharacterized protein ChrSW_3101 [Chromobacterium vaccinii]QND90558.1 Uncharacterized protein ChrSV_3101 [Chromobacterium vaccinii]